MNIAKAPAQYSEFDQNSMRGSIAQADLQNRKKQTDVEIAGKERLILTDSVTGDRGVITVVSGVVTWTAL